MVGITGAFVVAVTVNTPRYGAVEGTPVKATVGVSVLMLTVRLATPFAAPEVAVIVAVPIPTPVARPAAFMVATAELDDDQFTAFVTFAVVPSV
jgi:hypothetical protein